MFGCTNCHTTELSKYSLLDDNCGSRTKCFGLNRASSGATRIYNIKILSEVPAASIIREMIMLDIRIVEMSLSFGSLRHTVLKTKFYAAQNVSLHLRY
jgi:hypothetical protein